MRRLFMILTAFAFMACESSDKGIIEGMSAPNFQYLMTVYGCVTDACGNPLSHILIKSDQAEVMQITDDNGEYRYSVGFEQNPWLNGIEPHMSLTFVDLRPNRGFVDKTISFEFTEEHLVDDRDVEVRYFRKDGDVTLAIE